MATQDGTSPAGDAKESPQPAQRPHPTVGETTLAWVQLAGATALVNLVIYAVARGLGAQMVADLGPMSQTVGPVAIVVASLGTLFLSTFAWGLVAHRTPAFAELWVPMGWGLGLVSMAAILGASGVSTAITLGLMHLLTTAVAAHLIPRRLPR